MRGTHPVRNDTLLAVPVGQVNSNRGAVAVQVTDRDSQPLRGITVALSPSAANAVTDEFGCAVFTEVTPGGYTATVDQAGHVGVDDAQRATTPSVTVLPGRVAQAGTVLYDRAATVRIRWDAPGGYTAPGSGQRALVDRSMLTRKDVVDAADTLTVFPWSGSGLGVSAGVCTPAPGAQVQVATTPGQTSDAVLPVGGVNIDTSAHPGPVSITLTRDPDADCTAGDQLVVATAATQNVHAVQVPYGSWQVTVSDPAGAPLATRPVTVSAVARTAAVTL